MTGDRAAASLRIGIDVGGTFTDVFLYEPVTGRYWLAKTPSTPQNQADGVLSGIREVCRRAGKEPASIDGVLHGTTVATNALLEGRGAKVGLLTSYGWRNVLHLADSWTPGPLFGFFSYTPPEPLVPYERVRALRERIAADGQVIYALDDQDVEEATNALLDEGAEAVTVCLLHSYAHPDHERRVGEVVRRVAADRGCPLPVSLSSEVSPEFREYERTVTTVVNAYLAPVMIRYLSRLEAALADLGVIAPLQVVRSDGGLMSAPTAQELPVETALSGPAGGVSGAAFIAARAGFGRIITFDMGGTSSDVAVCVNGRPSVTRETQVASFPVRVPSIDVSTIGAGGGSIASVVEITGALRVGPASAGADPGPACYGRGGTGPTVTDAHLVVGNLPPALLGGAMRLDAEASRAALAPIARHLDVSSERAAQAVLDIVNGGMLGALRVATVHKGLDPRQFGLLAFGGAGGLHANALAAMLGCYPVVVPPDPGVLSALGFIVADVRREFAQAFFSPLASLNVALVVKEMAALNERAHAWLDAEGVPADRQRVEHVVDMRYRRQGYEIGVELGDASLETLGVVRLGHLFAEAHERSYGFSLPTEVEVVTVRARACGAVEAMPAAFSEPGDRDPSPALTGRQLAWEGDRGFEVAVYERASLRAGMVVPGRALITQYDSTTVVLAGHAATVDGWGNLVIRSTTAAAGSRS